MLKFKTLALALLASAIINNSAIAEDTATECDSLCGASLSLQTDLYSAYMYRGINQYDGISIQPSVTGELSLGDYGSIGGYVWSHFSADEQTSSEERFTEIDYNLYYTNSYDIFTAEAGIGWYTYPDGDDHVPTTVEYYITLEADILLTPTLTYYRDFDEFNADYFELSFSEEIETNLLGDGFNFTPYIVLGFANDNDLVYSHDGLEQITIGTSFEAKLGDIAVIPSINYNFATSSSTDNQFWAGVTFKYDI